MKYLQQTQPKTWVLNNKTYLIYFIREISGILLGFISTCFVFLTSIELFINKSNHRIIPIEIYKYLNIFALIFGVIHTITWIYAMPKILPGHLKPKQQIAASLTLIIFWIVITYIYYALIIN